MINSNFPDVAPEKVRGVEATRPGQRDVAHMHAVKRVDLKGRDYYWMGFRGEPGDPPQGTDLRAVYEGRVSITPLHLELTHQETLKRLKGRFGAYASPARAPLHLEEAPEGRADG